MSQTDMDRYFAAAHAMQSGVAAEQGRGSECGSPKHLRVGVNSALADCAALATLLIERGIFTLDEYQRAVADAMEAEQTRYEVRLSEATGVKVTLA